MKELIAGVSLVILIVMVGLFISPLAAPEVAKESSAEEPAAAAQAFKEAQR